MIGLLKKIAWPLASLPALGAMIALTAHAADELAKPDAFDARRPPAAELEMSVADGFTLAAVGDCIISRPLSPKLANDTAFAAAIAVLRSSDATFGNLETSILDVRHFDGHPNVGADDWGLSSLPAVAGDLAELGAEGMRETGRWLDEAGLVYAGVGENRGLARAPQYFESAKGRVALVSLASTYAPSAAASPARGSTAGRPGLNALRLQRFTIVPPDTMRTLAGVEAAMSVARGESIDTGEELPADLALFGTQFRLGDDFSYRYEMNQLDLSEILKNVRLAKQHADFVVVSIHAHESAFDQESPGDFLRELAHRAIDAGADTFVTHGIHHLGPVEVYAGKPVFYGLANFFWSDIQEPLDPVLYEAYGERLAEAFAEPSAATDADLAALLNASSFANDLTFQTVIAESRFEAGRVAEIRLHPIDLGYGRRLPDSGVPRLASSDQGRRIMERLQEISAPYGTRISVERNVGIIRP
jgi:poly-gamma-glutamate synthesis protein (capsule biosynthesis protein)